MRTYDRLSRQELRAIQTAKLARLVDRLREDSYYSSRLSHLPVQVTLDHLSQIPTTDKREYLIDQDRNPPFGSRLGVPRSEVAMAHMTGGTSGQGRETHGLTWRDVEATGHLSSFAFKWAGLKFQEPAAFNIGFSNSTGGNAMLRGIQALGNVPTLVAQMGFKERLEFLQAFPPVGMFATPSAINGLAKTASDMGINLREALPSLRFLLTAAEPYPVGWAMAMEETWGAKIFEDYGATQTASSIAASTCEYGAITAGGRGRMHLYEWAFIFEIIDPATGNSCAPGEFGELVITTLDKQASPVLRYRTRDRVKYLGMEGCACGRELMAIECGSITRYDDMLKIKGQNVWPAEMEAQVFRHMSVREFAGVVRIDDKGRDQLVLKIACTTTADPDALSSQIAEEFHTEFNITPTIEFVELNELPQWSSPEAKARRFTDVRSEGLSAMAQKVRS